VIKKFTCLCSVFLLAATSFQVSASTTSDISSTESLVSNCRVVVATENDNYAKAPTADSMFAGGVCMGYIDGLRTGLQLLKATNPNARVCIPQEVSISELARVLVKWADQHPELLHKIKVSGALAAWGEAFPCAANG
jgi:hypothetical protein